MVIQMNVLHICFKDTGGAHGAATRIHECLGESQQVESKFLLIWNNKHSEDKSYYSVQDSYKGFLGKLTLYIINYTNKWLDKLIKRYPQSSILIYLNCYFSFYNVEKHELIEWADVIHLHWVNKTVDLKKMFNNVKKTFVWTFHDMTPFTGGNPYESGLFERNKPAYDYFIDFKRRIIQNSNLIGHATSIGMKEKAIEYGVFQEDKISYLPYPINSEAFRELPMSNSKKLLGINPSQKVILFIAVDINDYRKGFDILLAILPNLLEMDYMLVTVGRECSELQEMEKVMNLGYISEPAKLAEIYSASDIFITPSREEAFGQTTIEAHMCGTPTVSFKTAGALGIIKTGYNGWLCDEINKESLLEGIVSCSEMLYSRTEIARDAYEKYSYANIVNGYLNMYSFAKKA